LKDTQKGKEALKVKLRKYSTRQGKVGTGNNFTFEGEDHFSFLKTS